MRAAAIILLLASVTSPELAGQQTSDSIPRELAVALLNRYGIPQSAVDIVVGRLPRSYPVDAMLRDDVRILGGTESALGATVVVDVPEPRERALERVVSHLERAGWRRAPEDENRVTGGFVPRAVARPTMFCRAHALLVITVPERPGAAGSRLHLAVSYPAETDAYSFCNRDADRGRRRYESRYPSLPDLEAPAGARMLGGSHGGGGPGSREANTRLETTQTASAVGAHYAEQLRRAGWSVSAPMRGDGVILYETRRKDLDKRQVYGILSVLNVPDTQQLDVAFRAVRVDLRR